MGRVTKPAAGKPLHGGRGHLCSFACGHCVHLDLSDGKAVCRVYDARPEACRAFRAGSFECVKARRANGIMGANVCDREGEVA